MPKTFRVTVAAALALTSISSPAAGPAADSAKLTTISLRLDWKPNAQFAGMLVAVQRGMYEREGLAVSVISADAALETTAAVYGHLNTIGIAEADKLLVDHARGFHVQAFATLMQATPFCLFTLKSSGLKTVGSLKTRRIGIHEDVKNTVDVMLEFNGMRRRDVSLVVIPPSVRPLISGQVDALLGYAVDEGVELRLAGHPVNVIRMGENGYVSYAEVIFASNEMVKTQPEVLVKFLRATREGWLYAMAHPDETARMIVEKYHPGDSVEEQRVSLEEIFPLLSAESHDDRIGMMRPETWARSVAMFKRLRLTGETVSAGDLVNYSILERLYGVGAAANPAKADAGVDH